MFRPRLRAVIAASLLCAFLPQAASAAQTYAERIREKILPNGLKVLLLEEHKAPVAVFQIWYRVGSRNEALGKTGLAHMLEHLMFKGTQKVAPEEYSKIIQRNGGNDNAFTSDDGTTYFATMASDRLSVIVDLEADRMRNLTFDDAQFEPEHHVVLEERRLRTDNNPVAALFELINSTAYSAHPYEWPTIGWMNDIAKVTRADALAFYHTYYQPGNAFIICVGDFSADQLQAQIDAAFSPVPPGDPPPAVRAVEPVQQGERRTVLKREAELPFVTLAYHVPNLSSPDGPALEVLAAILSEGKSSRLHQHLVHDQRLAHDVGAAYEMTSVDPGLFQIYGQPLPGKTTAAIEKQLLAELAALQNKPVGERELLKAKNGLEAGFVLAHDSLFYQALLLGQYELAGDWRQADNYVPAIRAITADDIQRVATFYFTPSNRTVGTLEPLPIPPGKRAPAESPPQGMVH
jgi:zinc protease